MEATLLNFTAGAVSTDDYLTLLALLTGAVTLYFIYKVFYRRDFGVPVRRKVFQLHMHVERDQIAFVPFWWSDIQVQRAIKAHWRQALRQGFGGVPQRQG